MKKSHRTGLRTWIEIDRKAVAHNFRIFRSLIPKKTKFMAVIKSNAYGHSIVDFAHEMEKLGADFLGVDSIMEGLTLRTEGIRTPILVLGHTLPEMVEEAARKNISLSVSTFELLTYIIANQKKFSKSLSIHIKTDTGMHRQGFLMTDIKKVLDILGAQKSTKVHVEGLFTHFATAKNPATPKATENQLENFNLWIQYFKQTGFRFIAHAAATSGTLLFPDAHLDMVRIGIGLYGLWPAREVKTALSKKISLRPVLSWKSVVAEIKDIPKGSSVGYDLTETVSRNTTLAIIPIGYWHGYPRVLSSVGIMLVKNVECKVLGRVSMDMVCIDVTKVKSLHVGDEVTIIGSDPSSPCSMEGVSGIADLSWYETVTRLNPLIKRIYI